MIREGMEEAFGERCQHYRLMHLIRWAKTFGFAAAGAYQKGPVHMAVAAAAAAASEPEQAHKPAVHTVAAGHCSAVAAAAAEWAASGSET